MPKVAKAKKTQKRSIAEYLSDDDSPPCFVPTKLFPKKRGGETFASWLVTSNCPDNVDEEEWKRDNVAIPPIQKLYLKGDCVYACGQFERGGNTNRLHLQMFIVTSVLRKPVWVYNRVIGNVKPKNDTSDDHMKSDEAMREYCCNPEKDSFIEIGFEFGEWETAKSHLEMLYNSEETPIKDTSPVMGRLYRLIDEGIITTVAQLKELFPHQYFTRPRDLTMEIDRAVARRQLIEYHATRPDQYLPRVWQYWLRKYLLEAPREDRCVIFVCDRTGCSGKSRFIQEMLRESTEDGFSVVNLCPAPLRDMADAYPTRGCDALLVDITRSKQSYSGHVYDFTENLKSGTVFSQKYDAFSKLFAPPHIAIMTNDPTPDFGDDGWHGVDTRQDEAMLSYMRTGKALDRGHRHGIENHESRERKPPFTYDRYMWWDLDEYPAMKDPYDPDEHPYFPPFKRVDIAFNVYEEVPKCMRKYAFRG